MGNSKSAQEAVLEAQWTAQVADLTIDRSRQGCDVKCQNYRRIAKAQLRSGNTSLAMDAVRNIYELKRTNRTHSEFQSQLMVMNNTLEVASSTAQLAKTLEASEAAMKAMNRGVARESKVKKMLSSFKTNKDGIEKSSTLLSNQFGLKQPDGDEKAMLAEIMSELKAEIAMETADKMPSVPVKQRIDLQLEQMETQLLHELDATSEAEDAALAARIANIGNSKRSSGSSSSGSSPSGSGGAVLVASGLVTQ
jgi:hypothetical protein